MEDFTYGRDYIDPKHVADGGVTRNHVRKWKVLQELQVTCSAAATLVLPPAFDNAMQEPVAGCTS